VDFKQTFESKGVLDAKQRLSRVSGDVREPFPAAVRAALLLHSCSAWHTVRNRHGSRAA
jgi:hypothetical protein